TGEYFRPLFDWLGIGDKIHSMPEIRRSTDIVGFVTAEAAQATGLPPGTPVIAGALDAAATAFGAGAYQKGDACTIFGTSLCNIAVQSAGEVSHANPCGSTLCGVAPDTYLRMMSTNNGSAFLDWAKGMFAPDLSFEELERQVSAVPMGSSGLLAHPYLNGERAPFQDASASGGFYGLTAGHTRMDVMRAAYEGLILSLKDCYREIPSSFTRAFVAGGGANSDLLCALAASAICVPVHRPRQNQLGICGIAAAVRYALGYAAKLEPPAFDGDTFLPNEQDAEMLNRLYAQYVALREQLRPHWHKFRQEA
ncbi:MAG: FGGY-family carbohydrate kinase, partial [Bacillota bacterium]